MIPSMCFICKRGDTQLFRLPPKEKGKKKRMKPQQAIGYICRYCR